jgi:hypothetical protein
MKAGSSDDPQQLHGDLAHALMEFFCGNDAAAWSATTVLHDRPVDPNGTGFRSYAAVPSSQHLRWLLPLEDRESTRKSLSIYTPFAPGARLMKSGLVAVLRYFSVWSRAHIALASDQTILPLERLVREHTGAARPLFAFALGTAGRFRKLTAQAMDEDGNVLGYIKIPLTPAAIERVRHEAQILSTLQAEPGLAGKVPKPLFAGPWATRFLLFTTPGPQSVGPTEFTKAHSELLDSIHAVRAIQRAGTELVKETADLWRNSRATANDSLRRSVEWALDAAEERLDRVLPCGLAHGDFAPWNLRRFDHVLFAFDWESARFGVPCMWDYFHFVVQSEGLLGKPFRKVSTLTRSDFGSFLLFLVDSICRSLQEDLDGSSGKNIAYKHKILARELERTKGSVRIAA